MRRRARTASVASRGCSEGAVVDGHVVRQARPASAPPRRSRPAVAEGLAEEGRAPRRATSNVQKQWTTRTLNPPPQERAVAPAPARRTRAGRRAGARRRRGRSRGRRAGGRPAGARGRLGGLLGVAPRHGTPTTGRDDDVGRAVRRVDRATGRRVVGVHDARPELGELPSADAAGAVDEQRRRDRPSGRGPRARGGSCPRRRGRGPAARRARRRGRWVGLPRDAEYRPRTSTPARRPVPASCRQRPADAVRPSTIVAAGAVAEPGSSSGASRRPAPPDRPSSPSRRRDRRPRRR